MKLSKAVALIAWVNVFALTWAMLFDLPPQENRWSVAITFLLFLTAAIISSNIQAQKAQERD